MLTRKHFKELARIMEIHRTPDNEKTLNLISASISNMCMRENPRFDRETFLKACGIGITEV